MEKVVHLLLLLVALPRLLEAASMTSALDSCLGKVLEKTWNNFDPMWQIPALVWLLGWGLSAGGRVGLGFWTMPWKCACLQAQLSTAMPSAAAITFLLGWCSFLAWDQSGWWTADMAPQPLGAEPLRGREWEPDHRVVQYTCVLQLQWHGHEMNFCLPGPAWTYCFELMPSLPPDLLKLDR